MNKTITAWISSFRQFLLKLTGKTATSTAKTVYIDGSASISPAITAAIAASSDAAVTEAKTPVVAALTTPTSTLTTDTSLADIFTVTLSQSVTMTCTNGVDGKATTWMLTQGSGGGKTITLGAAFALPSSASSLTWSTEAGKTDILAARYSALKSKWLVVSVVPGY